MTRRDLFRLMAGASALAFSPGLAFSRPREAGRGLVSFTFDDGLRGVHAHALPILAQRGQPATVGVIASNLLSNDPDLLTVEQLRELEAAGWEIASHSLTHVRPDHIPKDYARERVEGWTAAPGQASILQASYAYEAVADLYQDQFRLERADHIAALKAGPGRFFFDPEAARLWLHPLPGGQDGFLSIASGSFEREMEASKRLLTEHGFRVRTFIAPFTYWPGDFGTLCARYYDFAVAGDGGENRRAGFDPLHIRRFLVRSGDPPSSLMRIVSEYAVDQGGWVVFCLHGVGDDAGYEPYGAKKLERVSAFIADQGVPVVTIAQGGTRFA